MYVKDPHHKDERLIGTVPLSFCMIFMVVWWKIGMYLLSKGIVGVLLASVPALGVFLHLIFCIRCIQVIFEKDPAPSIIEDKKPELVLLK